MHMYHQLLFVLAQPFVRLCFLRRTGVELVLERHNDFNGLGFRTLDKGVAYAHSSPAVLHTAFAG